MADEKDVVKGSFEDVETRISDARLQLRLRGAIGDYVRVLLENPSGDKRALAWARRNPAGADVETIKQFLRDVLKTFSGVTNNDDFSDQNLADAVQKLASKFYPKVAF